MPEPKDPFNVGKTEKNKENSVESIEGGLSELLRQLNETTLNSLVEKLPKSFDEKFSDPELEERTPSQIDLGWRRQLLDVTERSDSLPLTFFAFPENLEKTAFIQNSAYVEKESKTKSTWSPGISMKKDIEADKYIVALSNMGEEAFSEIFEKNTRPEIQEEFNLIKRAFWELPIRHPIHKNASYNLDIGRHDTPEGFTMRNFARRFSDFHKKYPEESEYFFKLTKVPMSEREYEIHSTKKVQTLKDILMISSHTTVQMPRRVQSLLQQLKI